MVNTAGSTWTPALRAVTIAPVPSVENPLVAPIQQVAAQTSGPVQSAFVTVPGSGQQQPQPLLVKPVTTQSESHSVVPPIVGSSSFIPVPTLSVALSSSTSTSRIPGSTLYRPISASAKRFSIRTSSIYSMFQSMGLDSSTQRESMTSSMKYGAPVEIREEEILFPLEEAQQMLNEPLQTFLNRFTDDSTPNIKLLHLQPITSVLSMLGYTLEENYHKSSVQV